MVKVARQQDNLEAIFGFVSHHETCVFVLSAGPRPVQDRETCLD
jgi:hypothetical protein